MSPLVACGTISSIFSINRMHIISDDQNNNFYECIYEDQNHLVDAKKSLIMIKYCYIMLQINLKMDLRTNFRKKSSSKMG